MKRLSVLLGALLVVGTMASAKEILVQPEHSKEVVSAPVTGKEVIVEPVEEVVEVVAPVAEPVVVAPAPAGFVTVRAGGDVYSKYDDISNLSLGDETKGLGYEIGAEAYKSFGAADLGLGTAFQDHSERKSVNGVSGGEFKSVPVYLTGRYNFNQDGTWKPYLKANVGYSFNFDSKDVAGVSTDVTDGLYWAAGAGVNYNNVDVDLMYGVNESDLKAAGHKYNNDIERVTLSVGYRFNY